MSSGNDSEILFHTPKFQVVRRSHPDEPSSPVIFVDHPGAVAILPILDDGRLVLLRNFRRAIGKELLEVPAGTLRPGEPPQMGAIRELAEETGYQARIWQEIIDFYVSPGITNEKMTLFFARGLVAGTATPEPDEEISVRLMTPDECRQALEDRTIRDAKSIIALLIYFSGESVFKR